MRNLVREVAGFAPYERRITELLRVGKNKRALKLGKRKLGTHNGQKRYTIDLTTNIREIPVSPDVTVTTN